MSCGHCASTFSKAIETAIPGSSVAADLQSKIVSVRAQRTLPGSRRSSRRLSTRQCPHDKRVIGAPLRHVLHHRATLLRHLHHLLLPDRRGLFSAHFSAILDIAMKRWSARQLVAMFLAVFVAVGMSLSTVQASGMSAKMAMASDMAGPSHDGCQGCPTGGDDGMAGMTCGTVCTAPPLAVLPVQGALMPALQKPVPFAGRDPLRDGRLSPPDPYPPRTTDIG